MEWGGIPGVTLICLIPGARFAKGVDATMLSNIS
jgi:hypothetical protein